MKCSLILLTFGYVEEAYVGTIILKSQDPFASGIEGLHDLAQGLLSIYADEVVGPNRKMDCCRTFAAKRDPGQQYCPTCRTPLDTQWDLDTWKNWLHGLGNLLTHEWPHELEYRTDWQPWASAEEIFTTPKDEILVIPEHGEDTITKALKGDELDDSGYSTMIKEAWEWYTQRARELGRQGYDRAAFARDLDSSPREDLDRAFRLGL